MFKNHPRGLQALFFTEIWERFGFYILMAILVLYMDQEFSWDDSRKGTVYGLFLGLVYFLPILGGWLSDRVLGHKRTIQSGAMIAPLAATFIGATLHSYRISFVAAAIGMVFCLILFRLGQKHLAQEVMRPDVKPLSGASVHAAPNKEQDRQRIVTLIILFAIVIFFWVGYYQNGFTLTLFAQRSTIVSKILRPETYQFFGAFFILVLTTLLLSMKKLSRFTKS